MPIKPENRARYPENWAEIRAAILARAEDRCESCGVPNKAWRLAGFDQWTFDLFAADEWTEKGKVSKVVLTIAHIHDPDPANCDPENLKALCQRCHNTLDAPMRARNARTTRRSKLACRELFADAP
jgi:5-methylcytosine-specific restriction endonuclease McrA